MPATEPVGKIGEIRGIEREIGDEVGARFAFAINPLNPREECNGQQNFLPVSGRQSGRERGEDSQMVFPDTPLKPPPQRLGFPFRGYRTFGIASRNDIAKEWDETSEEVA